MSICTEKSRTADTEQMSMDSFNIYVDKRLETYSTKHVENRFNPNFAKNIECRIGWTLILPHD